jgi:aminotransferase
MATYGMVEIERYIRSFDPADLIKLSLGEPDFDTPDHIREAAILAIREGKTHYTPGDGIGELREAIAEKLRSENGLQYSPDQVSVVSGSQEGLSVVAEGLFSQGDEVIMSNPYYPPYFLNTILRGSKPVFVPLLRENGYQMMAKDIEGVLSPKTKAIIIVSPNNPTGGMQSPEEFKAIAEIAIDNDLIVISDEIYESMVYDQRKHYSIGSLPGMLERTITQNGFSKAYAMTGWRIGYFAAPRELCSKLQEIHRATAICANSVSQYAALAALRGPQDCVKQMAREFEKRRNLVAKLLHEIPDLQAAEPMGAFYYFPDFSAYTNDDRSFVTELVRETKVVTIPGSSFGSLGRNHVRVCFTTSFDRLQEAIVRVRDYLATGRRR